MFDSEVVFTKLIVTYRDMGSVNCYFLTGSDWGCFRLGLYTRILTCVINSPS